MGCFEYLEPSSISEALQLLEIYGTKAKLLSGGTDLLVQIRHNDFRPHYLIDLKRIDEMRGRIIDSPLEGMKLSSLTAIFEIETSTEIGIKFPILAEAAGTIGSPQIRNRATLGGNLCRAAPSGDMIPPLLVLDAQVVIQGWSGERCIPLSDFFIGPGKTILRHNEILREIVIPPPPSNGAGIFLKYGLRQTMDLAIAGCAIFLVLDYGNKFPFCQDARIALASVGPTPLRAASAEKALIGKKMSPAVISEVAQWAIQDSCPISDIYGSAWYKRKLVAVLVQQALGQLIKKGYEK